MKTMTLRLILLLAAMTSLRAAMESVAIDVTVEPQLPAALRMEGLRSGRLVLVLSVGADGQLKDALVLVASHRELIKPCLEAIQEWRFRPARLDGVPVSVALELEIYISQTGAVVSRTPTELLGEFMDQVIGRPDDYQLCPAAQVDGPLVALKRVNPIYPLQAAQLGLTGKVRVKFYVDEQGNVRLPTVTAEAPPYLSNQAVEALRNWKFAPATRQGRPVLVAAVQEFDFGGGR